MKKPVANFATHLVIFGILIKDIATVATFA